MVLQAIKYKRGKLEILDQLKLPYEEVYLDISSPQDAWAAIKNMQVRGAPAIAMVAALSLAVWCIRYGVEQRNQMHIGPELLQDSLTYLVTSRPTAVNLADAAAKLSRVVLLAAKEADATASSITNAYIEAAEQMLIDDVQDNQSIGEFGAKWLLGSTEAPTAAKGISILTHCNTGSLATAGYGTALGIIRTLHSHSKLQHVYYTETRPYNQGSRLTGYELLHDNIPCTLITDSMAGALLQLKKHSSNIAAVVVGADRVAANGDTANKIGTYSLAILARYHGVIFIVAAPRTTIDLATKSGQDIVIEERPQGEVTTARGPPVVKKPDDSGAVEVYTGESVQISIAAANTRAWNPAFDVTPAELIDGIATEVGFVERGAEGFDLTKLFEKGEVAGQICIEAETG
ncbi:MAG: hypothetical protein Q9191_006831 [Dirinaria sp. TL-2023a]